jgi:hypothetical protein
MEEIGLAVPEKVYISLLQSLFYLNI